MWDCKGIFQNILFFWTWVSCCVVKYYGITFTPRSLAEHRGKQCCCQYLYFTLFNFTFRFLQFHFYLFFKYFTFTFISSSFWLNREGNSASANIFSTSYYQLYFLIKIIKCGSSPLWFSQMLITIKSREADYC